MKGLEESIMTIFEVVLLVGVLAFAQKLSSMNVDDVSYIQDLLPPGACVEVYSSRPLSFNGTIHGTALVVCRNSSGVVVMPP
ncbi:hypothetical protein IG193_04310 [Infirmifilum lucidum]|uniref:Uncharacterized protein n=1 Tax=Infirmifilum lucidum TaxID=2776706 RepID=A0A7L9FKY2_9CREN|nr:hypothetical protein [Infirmifilum lucidum]QOJ79683.1 hypothetical protein IG193_04310 [Infirmifilum lucidum]